MRNLIIAIDPSQAYGGDNVGHVGFYKLAFDENFSVLEEKCEQVLLKSPKDDNLVIDTLKRFYDRNAFNIYVIVEDYILYENKTIFQVNKTFPINELIGYIKYFVEQWENVLFVKQRAQLIKKTFADKILKHRKIIDVSKRKYILSSNKQELSKHERDAIRHGQYFFEKLKVSGKR
jgi:hypothetical protein